MAEARVGRREVGLDNVNVELLDPVDRSLLFAFGSVKR